MITPMNPPVPRRPLLLFAAASLAPRAFAGAGQAFGFSSAVGDERNVAMRLNATGTVTAVDAAARLMAVETPRGIITFRLDPKVANAEEIRAGDTVQVDYVAAFVLSRRRGGFRMKQAVPPGGSLSDSYDRPVVFLCDVLQVDKENLVLRLRSPGGEVGDYPVYDSSTLAGMRVGDKIVASMNQAVAVGVTTVTR
jgi:hypothetical protein